MKTAVLIKIFLFLPAILFSMDNDPVVETAGRLFDYKPPLRLTFAGDIMAHSINYQMEDLSAIYRGVEHILLQDDLSFGNLEYPSVPDKPQASFPDFNVHPSYTEAAIMGGFDVFSLANNHTMDMGTEGLLSTLEIAEGLRSNMPYRVWTSGIKRPEEPWTATDIHTKGWHIGFVAASQYSNTPADPDLLRLVDYRRDDEAEEFIRWVEERAADYDLFIVSYHGGIEYNRSVHGEKRRFFLRLIDAGVDIVYAHHPHVLQPVEIIPTDDGEKVILNSCGNFISGQNRIIDPALPAEDWSYTGDGALFRVEVVEIAERKSIGILKPVLIGNLITADRDVVVLPLEEMAVLPLYGRWSEFYRSRYEIMSAWVEKDFLIEHPYRQRAGRLTMTGQ